MNIALDLLLAIGVLIVFIVIGVAVMGWVEENIL